MAVLKQYRELIEKNGYFLTGSIAIDTIDFFDQVLSGLNNLTLKEPDHFIFRGVNEAKYKLYNSAQRNFFWEGFSDRPETYKQYVLNKIDNYRREKGDLLVKFLNEENIAEDNYLAILSFMQHFGYPSPCLDFSKDILIALFFAFYNCTQPTGYEIEDYVSLYFLSKKALPIYFTDFSEPLLQGLTIRNVIKRDVDKDHFSLNNRIPFDNLFTLGNNSSPFSTDITLNGAIDYRTVNNKNIRRQKGVLLFSSDPLLSFEDSFKETFSTSPDPNWLGIKCINFHKSLKNHVQKILAEKGVTKESILFEHE